MSSLLLTLHYRLQHALESGFHPERWSAAPEMAQALSSVKAQFDATEVKLNERSIGKALLTFRNTGDLPNFIELKYACYGLTQQVGPLKWSLIEDAERFPEFLRRVDKEQVNPRRFRKCYQGLTQSYFSYGIFDNPGEVAKTNWKRLQKYLRDRLSVALSASNMPSWLRTLSDHGNLLFPNPCERYIPALIKGDGSELAAAVEGVGIASTSWIWHEAMLAHTQAVVRKTDDAEFRALMEPLIDLLDGKGDIALSETLVAQCAALLLIRYTKCKERTEHPKLRDLAVNHIGNPWLNRAAWDAYVNIDEARKMVDGWLKRRLITDFFALLAQDGAANTERLDYWLRFEPVITDMWFALGTQARMNTSIEFRGMRKRMEGRLHYLDGTTANNNAFIMRIGPFLVVEFGVTGNACYVYNAADLFIDQNKRYLNINELKVKAKAAEWLTHAYDWGAKFDAWLCPRIGWNPTSPTKQTTEPVRLGGAFNSRVTAPTAAASDEYKLFAISYRLAHHDNRPKGGAFWIETGDSDPFVTRRLKEMDFKYSPGKGWWKGVEDA